MSVYTSDLHVHCSIALLDECVQTFYEDTECSQVEALEAATLHPALLLGKQLPLVCMDETRILYLLHNNWLFSF